MSDEIELEDNVDNSQAEIDFEKAFDSDEEDIQEDDKTQDQDDSKDQVKKKTFKMMILIIKSKNVLMN